MQARLDGLVRMLGARLDAGPDTVRYQSGDGGGGMAIIATIVCGALRNCLPAGLDVLIGAEHPARATLRPAPPRAGSIEAPVNHTRE